MTGEPTSSDETSDNQAGADRTEEVWTYAGRRAFKGKRFYAWQDPHRRERYYAKSAATMIGGRYVVTVSREDTNTWIHGEPRYTGEQVDVGRNERSPDDDAPAGERARPCGDDGGCGSAFTPRSALDQSIVQVSPERRSAARSSSPTPSRAAASCSSTPSA